MPENMLWPLLAPLIAVQFILMCVALVSLARSERANGPKWLWAIMIVLLNIPGTIWRVPGVRYLPSALPADAAAQLIPSARTESFGGAIAVAILLSIGCAILAVILLQNRNTLLPDGR